MSNGNKFESILTCDHKNKKILLFPDFSSTGVWCECGCGFGNPLINFFHIPEGVMELIQLWNDYWQDSCFLDSYWDGVPTTEEVEFRQARVNKMGRELSKIVSRYHPCVFMEERSKIIFLSGEN